MQINNIGGYLLVFIQAACEKLNPFGQIPLIQNMILLLELNKAYQSLSPVYPHGINVGSK
jgi:hypothetical protein